MATTTGERQAKLERFVALDALATFLANLGSTAGVITPTSDSGAASSSSPTRNSAR